MTQRQVTALRDETLRALADWDERDGILVPTCPNPLEREIHRERLRVGLDVLERILTG